MLFRLGIFFRPCGSMLMIVCIHVSTTISRSYSEEWWIIIDRIELSIYHMHRRETCRLPTYLPTWLAELVVMLLASLGRGKEKGFGRDGMLGMLDVAKKRFLFAMVCLGSRVGS